MIELTHLAVARAATPAVVIAVDPGKRRAGVAILVADAAGAPPRLRLTEWLADPGSLSWPLTTDLRAVIEVPQVYRAGTSRGDPNDLVDVALTAGRWWQRLAEAGADVTLTRPRAWKGNPPRKSITHRRALPVLDARERRLWDVISGPGDDDRRDAACLGLWLAGRVRFC